MVVPGGDNFLVGTGLGRFRHQTVLVIIGAGVGVVGVEGEVHARVAELVFLPPPIPHSIHHLSSTHGPVGGEDMDLPRATTGGAHDPADLADTEDLPGLLGRCQGQVNDRVSDRPGLLFTVFVGVGHLGEQLFFDVFGGAFAPGEYVKTSRIHVFEQGWGPSSAVEADQHPPLVPDRGAQFRE